MDVQTGIPEAAVASIVVILAKLRVVVHVLRRTEVFGLLLWLGYLVLIQFAVF